MRMSQASTVLTFVLPSGLVACLYKLDDISAPTLSGQAKAHFNVPLPDLQAMQGRVTNVYSYTRKPQTMWQLELHLYAGTNSFPTWCLVPKIFQYGLPISNMHTSMWSLQTECQIAFRF
jgi:hypothetical protein